ncbi:protein of unknown function DUF885 [Paraglaciecola sp. T6c]|uniref:DUF885 domain-containing protein n=1 Tax=Pseudoalteromonas atlantica (strain T6c / ATCC BAA-1087) TaxID=3042615 RepID=UPI00005C5470|nr:DUF885 domain-containing protein [Paraglaciecola sp. T6c]ABG41092.1 protein of unknown function DUF885 [Paraglaciecola sp. T6c]
MIKRLLIPFALSAVVSACSTSHDQGASALQAPNAQQAQNVVNTQRNQAQLQTLVEQYTKQFLRYEPLLSTAIGVPESLAGAGYNRRFTDFSAMGMRKLQDDMNTAAMAVAKVDNKGFAQDEKRHQQIVTDILRYYAGFSEFHGGYIDTWAGHLPYIINQLSGPLIDVPKVMQVQQPVSNFEEAQDYIARLQHFDFLVAGVVEKYKTDKLNGVQLPKKLYPKTLAYFENFLGSPVAEHALVTSFAKKLEQTPLSQDEQTALIKQAQEALTNVVYPAYQTVKDTLLATQANAPQGDGIWAQPNGDAMYLHEVRYLGDSSITPDDIHQLGLDEVARISTEMDTILRAQGYDEGPVGERMVLLAEQPEFLYQDSDEGRAQLLNDLNGQIAEIMAKTDMYYGALPTQKVEVKRIPKVTEAGEAGGYYSQPSLDGERPGIFWINLRDMSAVPSFSLKTLTYHEAVPGHHFQIALNMAQQDIGLLRQNAPFNAYVEGWALYSELVAKEMGMYENDPFGDLGRLQAELYRAVRLVVDTGLHRKKWTREQAIEYFHETTGTGMTDVIAEVERYMALPGQALGYKLGMLQFVELRQMAERELGSEFDLKRFHDLLLLPGARPMSVVRSDVKRWIASNGAG